MSGSDGILLDRIIEALHELQQSAVSHVKIIQSYNLIKQGNPRLNQFLIFLKPEAINRFSSIQSREVLELFFAHLQLHDIAVSAISVLPGPYLKRHRIVEKLYLVLNSVSRCGNKALSGNASKQLTEYCQSLPHPMVLGGHQILKKFADLTPLGLCVLVNNRSITKLGAGVYAAIADWFGKKLVVLNGFHPYQVEALSDDKSALLAVECWSGTAFKALRNEVIGTVDPSSAQAGSLRRIFFDRSLSLGFQEVCIQFNFVHISPGPLEAAFQLATAFTDHDTKLQFDVRDTNMGRLLEDEGTNIRALCDVDGSFPVASPQVSSIFERTETMDTSQLLTAEILNLLKLIDHNKEMEE